MTGALIGCTVFLIFGFLFKAQCLEDFNGRAYERLCYNDLQPLFGMRLFRTDTSERVFPYLHGAFVDGDDENDDPDDLVDGAIEYPVLTGLFMYGSGLLADDANEYLRWSAILLAPFGLLVAYLLARMRGWRALLWALAPPLVLYAFHNWDLLVVAAAVTGIWLWSRGNHVSAAVLFGIGAGFKMYPAFFLAPLFLDRLFARQVQTAIATAVAGVTTIAVVNIPFALANPDGWFATYAFHSARGPNFDSIWYFGFPTWAPERLNIVTAVMTGTFFVIALGAGWVVARRRGTYPFIEVCGALLAAFLLWNKVHSPQYTLWLLPFFVLVRVNIAWWLAYLVADAAVYVGIFRWFHDWGRGLDFTPMKKLLIAGVWTRAALLLALFAVFLRPRPERDDSEAAWSRDPSPAPAPQMADAVPVSPSG